MSYLSSTYTYDQENRLSSTAGMNSAYDSGSNAIGHMTSLTDQAGTASYTYDILGRLATETRTLTGANNGAISKNLSYEYNLDGSLKTLHYPSGAAVTYAPDSAGRILSAIDSSNGINYVTSATYGPDSALTGFISGYSASFAGITNAFSYNQRLQPVNMSASGPSQTVFSIGYDFHVGNGSSGADNGNVFGITNYKDTSRNQTFTYDLLNRLISAQNAGTSCAAGTVNGKTEYWGNSYGYDAWGNLLQKSITKCGAENLSVTADGHNWIHAAGTDYQYDAAGNMSFDATAGLSYTFDQENRLTGAAGYAYTYDGDGNRAIKSNGSTGTLYWYMTPGIVGESDLSGNLTDEYVFFDGERVARKSTNGVFYYFSDHLKTASVITDASGNIKSESDFYPWGGELQFVNNDSNHYKFTGKERDTETQLDYFGARYYSNGFGRFVTSDWSATPVPVPYADLTDPQSLNQYSYVRNIPTVKIDADGHDGGVDTEVEVDMQMVKQTLQQLGPEGGMGPLGTLIPGVLGGVLLERGLDYAADTSQINSKAQWDDVAASNRIILAKQAASQQQQQQQNQTDKPKADADPQTSSGGARQGGGRNAQKSNQNRQQSAQDNYNKAKADYEKAKKQPPSQERTQDMEQAKKQMKHWQKKMHEQSETHSRKHKGQQQ